MFVNAYNKVYLFICWTIDIIFKLANIPKYYNSSRITNFKSQPNNKNKNKLRVIKTL